MANIWIFKVQKMILNVQSMKLCHCRSKGIIWGRKRMRKEMNLFFSFVPSVHDCSAAAELHFTDCVVWNSDSQMCHKFDRLSLKIWPCSASSMFWSMVKSWLEKKSYKEGRNSFYFRVSFSTTLQILLRSIFFYLCFFPLTFPPLEILFFFLKV